MTSKEKVKAKHPRANAQSYKNPQGRTTHWLIWSDWRRSARLGEGKTQSAAWVNAAKYLSALPAVLGKAESNAQTK